nr:BGTF surface domain-containing protein [Natronomonas gomsonensis]
MTDNNSKLRAVLLAALMVLWVFAGTMAFAGGAAAGVGDGITIDNVDVNPQTGDQTATYTINTTFDQQGSPQSDVTSGTVDLSDADSAGIDASSGTVRVFNASDGSEITTTSVSESGGVIDFDLDTAVNTSNTTGLNIVLEDVDNPSAGTYDVTTTLYETAGQSDNNSTDTASYSIGASSASEAGADGAYDTGTTRWQGQELFFDQGALSDNHSNWQVRNWDRTASNDRLGSLVSELSFENGQTVIDTSNLEGDYVITANDDSASGENREVIITNNQGVATDSVSSNSSAATNEYVEIVVQNLDATFEDADGDEVDDVDLDDSRTLVLDSNRNGFGVEVSSENLTQDQLEKVFDDSTYSVAPTSDDDDNVTISGLQSESEIEATFNESNDIEEGDSLDFNFEATDTTANADASITVGEVTDGDANWDQAQYDENRGDVVTVSLTSEELDRFNVSLGSDDANYQADLEVEPNDDGEVELEINTYLASRVALDDPSVSTGDIYDTTDDGGEILNRSETGINDRALDPGLYDLIIEDSNITTAEEEIQEYDVSVLSLQERSTGNMTIHTAPSNDYTSITETEDVLEMIEEGQITETNTIALNTERDSSVRGDAVIHRIDVSGIGGLLASDGQTDYEQIANNNNLNLTLEQQNPGQNEDAFVGNLSDIGSSSTNVISDTDNDTLYVVLNSNALEAAGLEEGDELEASFNVTGQYQNQFLRERNHVDPADPDDDESAMGTYELVDREATFDTVNDEVRVQSAADQVISGETTVAPGTEITVRARATAEDTDGENAFLKSASTEVNADGTFEATFNGSDSFEDVTPPQNFTATIQRQSFEDDAETDGRVIEGDYAEVSITNQTTDGTTVTVDSVYVPDGGFVTIHDGTLLDGATFDSVRGTSDYLESGEHEDVEVTLDTPYEGDNGTVIAMPHQDSNDNEEYDFVTSEGEEDAPYLNAEGEIVLDSATLTVDTSTPTPTATATATPEPTATATDEPATDEPTETESEDQPGFGAVIALIALLGAALLAARRNAF